MHIRFYLNYNHLTHVITDIIDFIEIVKNHTPKHIVKQVYLCNNSMTVDLFYLKKNPRFGNQTWIFILLMVGLARFELAASRPPDVRANRTALQPEDYISDN